MQQKEARVALRSVDLGDPCFALLGLLASQQWIGIQLESWCGGGREIGSGGDVDLLRRDPVGEQESGYQGKAGFLMPLVRTHSIGG